MRAQAPIRNRISFRLNNAETWAMGVDPANTGEQQFFIGAFSSTPLRIHQSGRVGIGATTAELNASATQQNTALLVNGNTRINGTTRVDGLLCVKEFRIQTQGTAPCWGDYVFDPDYRLRSIPELEVYVQQYGHLPGVPSKAVLERDGLDVHAMLAAQMVQIEELTLRIIHQQKELDSLKRELLIR